MFQNQRLLDALKALRSAIWLLVCALGLTSFPNAVIAQSTSAASNVVRNQSDLSLLAGPITILPPGGPTVETAKPSSIWPWESSGETPDPAIRFGRLANGMRYAIKRNDKPENEVALRFRYDVGSGYEEDSQLGYAHFLEHMAFNGSTNVPEGEFIKRMERLGAAFGQHVNASTSINETTYQFNLPKAKEGRLELALDLFRETADRLTLSQDAIDREKGVVASEQITRSSPMREQYLARQKLLYPRMRDTLRDPIGTTQSIESVTSERLRAFYQRWYRPERAILVIVGAVDVDATESMIKERFESWKPALNEPNPPKPSEGQWEDNKLAVYIDRSSGAQEEFIIQSERPDQRLFERGTREEAIVRSYVQTLTFNIIQGRLANAARRGDDPPYLSASYGGPFGGPVNARGLGWRAQMEFEPKNRNWQRGIKAVTLEMRRVLRDGFTQEDRDRAVADYSREYPSSGFSDFFDNSQMLASRLMIDLGNNSTPRAKQDLAAQRAERPRFLEQVTVERLNEEVRFYWRGVQPRFLITTQDPSLTEASAIAAWQEALAAPIPPREIIRPVRFEAVKLGPASRLVGRWREPGLDADFVRFENGVTLVVKPNTTRGVDATEPKRPAEMAIRVQLGAGWLAFGDGDGIGPSFANAEWRNSGFANLKAIELSEAFREASFDEISTEFSIAHARMSTNALESNLNLVLDIMLAKLVSPKLGTDSLGLFGDRIRQRLQERQQTVQDVFSQQRAGLYQTGSPLFAARTPEETLQAILNTDLAQANDQLRNILSNAPVSVIIVGDIDLDRAIAAIAPRFGALPKRPPFKTGIEIARNWRLRDGGGLTQVFQHTGNDDQAFVHFGWQIPNVPDGPARYALDLLEAVFQIRANDVIREAYGQTYSPSVQTSKLPGYGDNLVMAISAVVLPKDVAGVEARMASIVADLAANGPTDDEVSRARAPMLEANREACQANRCWLSKISNVLVQRAVGEREVRPWRNSDNYLPTLRALARQDLQALAKRYLVDSRLVRAHVVPQPKVASGVIN